MTRPRIYIGSLIRTCKGVVGVICRFNKKDELYTVLWSNGMRRGENVIYDKKTVDYMLNNGSWNQIVTGGKLC